MAPPPGKRAPEPRRERTPWLWLVPLLTIVPFLCSKLHYSLPEPLPPYDANGRTQPSEEIVLKHIQALEDIGYRTVGTYEAVLGEKYVEAEARALKERCDAGGVLDCEVWVQTGAGYHMFSIMSHDVLKLYSGITNIVLKISAKNPPSGKAPGKDSVLLGSHIDSTLPSPGAADDGMGVGVMLDIARVLIERNEPFDNSVIFMWNGGEETLQDGSHLYSTQHESANTVKAVINLEAAGTTGGALLFQATSREMIEAFWHAPYPRGTVIANDVFSSGIILSDTDFGQFEEYLEGVSGLDMAIVGHSYYYHTRKDITANIERGSSQHFTTNVMAILDYLLSAESPLHNDKPWSPPDVVYMSLYDRIFLHWTMETADKAYAVVAAIAAIFAIANLSGHGIKAFTVALVGAPLGIVFGLVSANVIAGVMMLIDRQMGWFSHEGLCVALYGPAAIFGHLGTQYVLGSLLSPVNRSGLERAHYYAQILFLCGTSLLLQSFRIRSAYVFAVLAGVMMIGALFHQVRRIVWERNSMPFVMAYVCPLVLFIGFGIEAYTTTLDIFVPLTGRMGKDAPHEILIASITAICTLTFFPIMVPLFARASRPGQRGTLAGLAVAFISVVVLFAGPWWSPYDATHQKRVAVQYTYNHTTGTPTAHLAFMDLPGNEKLVNEIHARYGQGTELVPTVLDDYNSDWDTLYPVSSFLITYKWPLEPVEFEWPGIKHKVTRTQVANGTRIHLSLEHAGLAWPSFAFVAEISDWKFGIPPPAGKKRHHIKSATSVDEHELELEFTVSDLKEGEKLNIHWSAIDINQMVPGTASRRGPDMPASKWLMDMDAWATEEYNDSLEIFMAGIVVGVIEA